MQHEHFSEFPSANIINIDLNSNYDKTYKVTAMIESLWTIDSQHFWVSAGGGGGGRGEVQKIFVQGSVQGDIVQYETTSENIVSWCQTLVSSLSRETVFLYGLPKTRINNCVWPERGIQ